MKRIFVTGGTGFIGSHFLRAAVAGGYDILALARSPESRPRIALERPPQWLSRPMHEVEASDLVGCDTLVHLAAHAVVPPHDSLENCLHWNLMVPLKLFHVAARAGVTRFVVAGTCFEYGRAGMRYEYIPPDAPLEPTGAYAASKAAASIAFGVFAAQVGVRLSIHRIFQVFGEGEAEGRLWPSLMSAALAGDDLPLTAGEQIRDFVPVEQVASQLLAACHDEAVERCQAKVTNIGTGRAQTVRAFAEHCWLQWKARGKLRFGELPYRAGEVMRYVPLIS
jgi:nucleoside-diphosphate-sugar epimerase